jgi:hypothetical protein
MMKFGHIINPVVVNKSSDLFAAQPVTFETLKAARKFAGGRVAVELFSAQYPEDRVLVPEGFKLTPDLNRSVLDIAEFSSKRKLPLITDILTRLYDASEADYFIYTNVDIAVMPYFYMAVNNIIESGYDAFTINRRTISKEHNDNRVMAMYAEIGEPHPGHDCFIFKKDLFPKFKLGTACIGAGRFGKVLITNLICHSDKFKVFKDKHLTFHLGDDRSHKVPDYKDYRNHNDQELYSILLKFKAAGLLNGKPMVERFLRKIERTDQKAIAKISRTIYDFILFLKTKLKKLLSIELKER